MKTRRQIPGSRRVWLNLILILCSLALGRGSLVAQQFTTLIQFTSVWKYDQSGNDLGTAWRAVDYDDAAWASGLGLLGWEPDTPSAYTQTAPILTPLTVSAGLVTYYFRTRFEFDGAMEGLSLIATNLVDDGCAIYLNGESVGGMRSTSPFNSSTFFFGPGAEGQLDVVTFTNLIALRQGENVLAVEVHQASAANTDVMFGMKLVVISDVPLVITSQPPSRIVSDGDPVAFSVGVSGGPASYRWQKNEISLPVTSSTLTIASAQFSDSADYRVICSNAVTVVTSSVATLKVVDDLSGAKVLGAVADNRSGGGGTFGLYTINILFSETMTSASVRNRDNYRVLKAGTSETIAIANVLYASVLGGLIQVDPADPNWERYGDYVVEINNVADVRGNLIAPDTRVPVAWGYSSNLITVAQSWDFHDSAIFDPGVYDEPWYAEDYVPGPWWGRGSGGFYGGPTLQYPCPSIAMPRIAISFQPEPTLFRTSFEWPAHWPNAGGLVLRFGADDALVLYINGIESYRYNAVGGIGSGVSIGSRSQTSAQSTFCVTNVVLNVTNLHSGTNWIAVAVLQGNVDQQDSYFVFDMSGTVLFAPELQGESRPVLQWSKLGPEEVSFSWMGSGYALEASDTLELGPSSYPAGPWTEVRGMSNPYTWRFTNGVQRYFRLKK